ncbi:tryptophan synthase subunit alpha [Pantoea sp. Nvir]|uniref:tryptophan synthase subunit alpha n=1 Tax=Pantoea sp. Nvir TaxID=2576760 RepID=UPI00135AAB35|nr:tryptophan synthase subunit alpha [Pantoea sp. Nvir]MXP66696.1 tryptophan synthase subunit alpha [Pantoea sp. Nvir]
MERYQQLFNQLNVDNEGAFIPFVTLGDPSPEMSLQIIDALIEGRADALELGIPFSDPLADGQTIQNSILRAFASGTTIVQCFDVINNIRLKYPDLPIGLLTYANLVFTNGIESFYARCAEVGVDSVLVVDVPIEESVPFRLMSLRHGIAPIFICPPNANKDLLRKIATYGSGYTYVMSRAGVTGIENRVCSQQLHHLIDMLREYNAAPPVQGFGISDPVQIKEAIGTGAAGVISGSAIVKIIEQYYLKPEDMLMMLTSFSSSLKDATCLSICV